MALLRMLHGFRHLLCGQCPYPFGQPEQVYLSQLAQSLQPFPFSKLIVYPLLLPNDAVFVVAVTVRGYKDARGLFRSRKKECDEYRGWVLAQAWSWVVVAALRP